MTVLASEKQLSHPEQRDPTTTTSNPGMKPKGGVFHVDYNVEGSDVGYRWYEARSLTPLFPLGFGLSYTTFETSGLAGVPRVARLSRPSRSRTPAHAMVRT